MFICFDMIHERDRQTDGHRMPAYACCAYAYHGAVKSKQQLRFYLKTVYESRVTLTFSDS